MKKTTFLKKSTLVGLLMMVMVASYCLMLQSAQATTQNENYSSIVRLEESNQNVGLIITPLGSKAVPDHVTLKQGQTLVITGTVTSDIGYSFKSITVNKNLWHFVPVLTSDDNSTQTDSNFSFNFKASSSGKEKLTFDVVFTNDQGGSKDLNDICPIEVTVE